MEQKIDEILSTVSETKNDVKSLKYEFADMKKDNEDLKCKIKQLEVMIHRSEIREKANDLIIYGVEESEHENYEEIEEKVQKVISEILKLNVSEADISNLIRMGIKRSGPRPILIRFVQTKKKIEIWKNRKAFKNSNYSMSENYTTQTLEKTKKLKPYLEKARKEGKRAVIRYDKLIINNQKFTLDQLEQKDGGTEEARDAAPAEDKIVTRNINRGAIKKSKRI